MTTWRMQLAIRSAPLGVVLIGAAILGGCGGQAAVPSARAVAPSASPSLTPAPTATTATAAPTATPAPSEVAPGITGWTPYTSEVYGLTLGLPDGWSQVSAATRKWQAGDESLEEAPSRDVFLNPPDRDGDQIVLLVWQRPAGSGADITSREGLVAWYQANLCEDACETVPDEAEPMCFGKTACLPAILVGVQAAFADAETGLVNIVLLGRSDDFPATARYGGGVQLVKSILATMDVWTPEPGQLPSGG